MRYQSQLGFCVAMFAVLFATDAFGQGRGYNPRGCGFDMNRNGVVGEAADCNVGDGVTADPDGDGVNEDIFYVDCQNGNDASAGTAGAPLRTLQRALNVLDGPADGAEDIIAFRGTCVLTSPLQLTRSGTATFYTRPQTGSEARAFRYPRNPVMIVGWDSDNDGVYPPFDTNDVAILDGNNGATTMAINNWGISANYLEFAHFTARNFGQGNTGGDQGFMVAASPSPTNYIYVHDLVLNGILRGRGDNSSSGYIVFHMFGSFQYFAIENLQCFECGGYFARGAGANQTGPYRFKNIGYAARGAATNGGAVLLKLWGEITGIELIDSTIDFNVGSWSPTLNGSMYAVGVAQCTQDWDIVNNEFRNYQLTILLQPYAFGACGSRRLDEITIDRNRFINDAGSISGRVGVLIEGYAEGGLTETVEDVLVSNNFFYSTTGMRANLESFGGNGQGANPGTIRYVHNTSYGSFTTPGWGGVTVWRTSVAFPLQNFYLRNNIFAGSSASSGPNLITTYTPTGWDSDFNVFDGDAGFSWNNGSDVSLATWRTLSNRGLGHDLASQECNPSFTAAASGDLHLTLNSSCGIDDGVTIPFGLLDIDGIPRAGIPDAGADEAGGGVGGPAPPTNVRIIR
jgi:hypothetical protein